MNISKKIFSFIMVLAMVLSALAPMVALATTPSETGSLTIHKYYFADKIPEGLPDGTGEDNQTVPTGAVPLAGAEFSIWKVADDATDTGMDPEGDPIVVTTDNNGLAVFDNLPLGRYYVEETKLPKGVTQGSEPFFIDIPTTSNDGTRLIKDVHVYPKNELVLGAVRLVKQDEDGKKLAGAEFDLYKVEGETETKIAESLVTNAQGEILVGDLEVGDYYFVETKAPTGYGLNTTPINFKIEKHAYSDNQLVEANVVKVILTNYLKPGEPEKEVNTANPGIGDTVTWTIKTNLPGDIKDYTVYKITDNLAEALNYEGNVKVTLGGTTLTQGTHYTLTEPTNTGGGQLVINFVPAQLSSGELVITFDTLINEKAVVGVPIENEAQLDYNNGFEEGSEKSPKTDVTVGGKKFKKVDGKDNVALQGAEFVVFKEVDGQKLYLKKDGSGMISWSNNKDSAYKFISDANGLIDIKGLAYGNYFIEEVKAPMGSDGKPYNLLQKPVKFTVDANSYKEEGMATIKNNKRPKMPQTGGMGTALFTVLGLGLMGLAVKSYKKED